MRIELVILFFLLAAIIVNHLKFNNLAIYISGIICILYFRNIGLNTNLSLMHFVYFFIGLFLASFLTQITFCITERIILKTCIIYPLNIRLAFYAAFEEVVWRLITISCIERMAETYISNYAAILIISIVVSTILFVAFHTGKGKKAYIEMSIYSIFISISWCLAPGMNYGLHIGRNCYITKIRSLNEKKFKREAGE